MSSNSLVSEALLQSFVREFYAPSLRMTTRLLDSQEKELKPVTPLCIGVAWRKL